MKKPIILCIMDGYGISEKIEGNAIREAHKPHLDEIFKTYPYTEIQASGEAVGLPEGQMGNSEVGHLNIGAGRIVYQSLTLINKALKDKSFFENKEYLAAINHALINDSKLHIFGLISDGGVHSHLKHILAMIEMAKARGLKDVFVHCFMDGRDVDPQAGYSYIKEITDLMERIQFGHIASIHGRYYAMDRDKNLARNDISYRVMIDHEGMSFTNIEEYFKSEYAKLVAEGKEASDEFLTPAYNANVDGKIGDNDAIIFMNYRPDRAIQIATMITNPYFYKEKFNYVPKTILENIFFVSTMKYADSVKGVIAFKLPQLDNVLGVYLANNGYKQMRIAETEKYAHVTFFFDGTINYDGVEQKELTGSRRVLVNSPKVATYDKKPEMSALEVLDKLLIELDKKDLDVVILNFANCDMVGHTAIDKAVVKAVETVDYCVGKIHEWTLKNGGVLILTADHGNAEEILDKTHRPMTAHTSNLVPFCVTDKDLKLAPIGVGKLSNIAPTILDLLGADKPSEMDEESLIIK